MAEQPNAPVPKTPHRLSAQGQALWDSIIPAYELRPDEVRILTDACREADIIERLEDELVEADLMVKGSMGQLVASPLVSEVRQHRTTLAGLLSKLKIPDTASGAARKRAVTSEKAVAAARARWGSGAGKGA
jgi:hypothetical protein